MNSAAAAAVARSKARDAPGRTADGSAAGFDVWMKARRNLGTMNERAKMRRLFRGAADTPFRRRTPPNQAMLVSSPRALSAYVKVAGVARIVALALSTAPYLIRLPDERALNLRPTLVAFVV